MKRTLAALSLAALALLTGCSDGNGDQTGDSNTDSQVEQPPVPSATP